MEIFRMYCGKCGQETADINKPCPNCGDKTIRYEHPQIEREPAVPDAQKKKRALFEPARRKKNRGVLFLIIIVAAIVLFYNSTDGAGSPEDAVRKLNDAFRSNNVGAMIEFTTYNETCQKALGNSLYNVKELKSQLEKAYQNKVRGDKKLTITGTYKPSGIELEQIAERLKMFFENLDNIEEIEIVKTREVTGSEEKDRTYYCLKISGRWYVSVELLQSDMLV
ncbi:MAG TPA: zinc ribbon domain-containing protein [Bacillota bacterium]|nr:zinc ribbon domain-containing protein [Bacillota bacterium]